jgi:hypothetical protein
LESLRKAAGSLGRCITLPWCIHLPIWYTYHIYIYIYIYLFNYLFI